MERRVVITGIGAVTPIGLGKDRFWQNLTDGVSGATEITKFDTTDYATKIAAEVKDDFDPHDFIDKKEARRMDPFCQYAVSAARMAIEDSGLPSSELGEDFGVLIACGIGGLKTIETQHTALLEKGPRRIHPLTIPMIIPNMASAQVAIQFGAKGPCTTVVTACAASCNGIGDAYEIIKRGDIKVMISGGAEAGVSTVSVAGFGIMGALSTRNDDPCKASRPFDKERDGFVLGEGSGIVILEELEHALNRNARIYGEITGYGMACEAFDVAGLAPDGNGMVRAMRIAIDKAGLSPGDVDYINAHGTSTPLNDRVETIAIKEVFGNSVPISSTKSMIGHSLGAAGALEVIACLLAINKGIVHPTINYEFPDEECDLDCVPNKAREMEVKAAVCNSQGFGGHSAALVVSAHEG
ncbi:MAG: beta-ketoacyl-ACP synthase II [Actinobacteria bacterium]|nr:beta-ketoacyl-ACP synthase II [Actinomycetota bacterium]